MKKTGLMIFPAVMVFLLSGCGEEVSTNERLHRAADALKENKPDVVAAEVAEVQKESPNNCSARLLLALQYEKQGDLDKAIDVASSAANEFPDSFAALYTCGRLQSLIPMRRRDAYATLERAIRINPGHTETLVLLSNLGTELKNQNVLTYLMALRSKPEFADNAVLLFQFGRYFLIKKNNSAALKFFKQVIHKGEDPELLFQTAIIIDTGKLDTGWAIVGYNKFLKSVDRNSERGKYAATRLKELQRSLSRRRRR